MLKLKEGSLKLTREMEWPEKLGGEMPTAMATVAASSTRRGRSGQNLWKQKVEKT